MLTKLEIIFVQLFFWVNIPIMFETTVQVPNKLTVSEFAPEK